MTVRFFMLQTHYRSTLDFSNEALQAAEKGLKRLWEAYEILDQIKLDTTEDNPNIIDPILDDKCKNLVAGFDEAMNDDFNTARVLANMFELVPIINSIKGGQIAPGSLRKDTLELMQKQLRIYLPGIFGLRDEKSNDSGILDGVIELLIQIRKDARNRKDFATSDKIRNELLIQGIALKDEKNGGTTWSLL